MSLNTIKLTYLFLYKRNNFILRLNIGIKTSDLRQNVIKTSVRNDFLSLNGYGFELVRLLTISFQKKIKTYYEF